MQSTLTLCALLCTLALTAQPEVQFTALDSTFAKPLGLVSRGDGSNHIYIIEKDGGIHRYDTETHEKTAFLNLAERLTTVGEGGLVGGAFHPNVDSNTFFIMYTVPGSGPLQPSTLELSRFTLDKDGLADPTTERLILTIPKPGQSQSGGGMAFGPDGYLYVGIGDGGGRYDQFENAQNPQSLMGKIIRIDVDESTDERNYGIPTTNPFAGSTDTLGEIWSLGVRNPFHIAFDDKTGDLWIGDKANTYWQEINYQAAGNTGGQNYGWNCMEGFEESTPSSLRFCGSDLTAYDAPRLVYGRDGNQDLKGGSVTGGEVYYGPDTSLHGLYIFGDFFSQRLFIYDPSSTGEDSVRVILDVPFYNLTTFGIDNQGALYATDYAGSVYRIGAPGATVEEPTSTRHAAPLALTTYPNPVQDRLTISRPAEMTGRATASITDLHGRRVYQSAESFTAAPTIDLSLPALPAGVYVLVVRTADRAASTRLIVE